MKTNNKMLEKTKAHEMPDVHNSAHYLCNLLPFPSFLPSPPSLFLFSPQFLLEPASLSITSTGQEYRFASVYAGDMVLIRSGYRGKEKKNFYQIERNWDRGES